MPVQGTHGRVGGKELISITSKRRDVESSVA